MRLLQVNCFPTLAARHGGQRRADQTAKAIEAAGHQVHRVAVCTATEATSQPCEPWFDLGAMPPPRHPFIINMDGARAIARSVSATAAFSALCEASRPDAVIFGLPWMWPAVLRLPSVSERRIPLIYNCENIEAPLKRRILEETGFEATQLITAEIEALEREVASMAWGCAAVTEADVTQLRAWGAGRVVLAPNGVEARPRDHLDRALPAPLRPEHRYLLYIGSAHPPNLTGFRRVMPHVLEALRPDERIVAAGGVAHLISTWLHEDGPVHLARDRLVLLPDVTDLALDALIHNASGLVLPMDSGGGSNLKTAEALHSGLPMVATKIAMRGYEAFADMDGVLIAESPQDCRAAIRRVFDDPPPRRLPSPRLDSLLWSNTLRPMVDLVAELAAEIDR